MAKWMLPCLLGAALLLTGAAVQGQSDDGDPPSLDTWQQKLKERLAQPGWGKPRQRQPDIRIMRAGDSEVIVTVEASERPCSIPLTSLAPEAKGLVRQVEPERGSRFAIVVADPPAPPCAAE